MKNILLFYVIAQLLSTAYGVAVIESLKPFIKAKLHSDGYVLKNKNSLYKYNEDLIDILKGFIPFYYAILAINLISCKNPIKNAVNNEIKSGKYIKKEEIESIKIQEPDSKSKTIDITKPNIVFEKPEKYTARKNDNALYDTYITPIEYVIKEANKEEELNITPYLDKDRVIEHVVVKQDASKKDIIKLLFDLNLNEFEQFEKTLPEIKNIIKRKESDKDNSLILKDVA